jgi:predicted small lipoprotein YifL
MRRRFAWIALVAALLLSTGCGLKGPLYLPDLPADNAGPRQNMAPRDNT